MSTPVNSLGIPYPFNGTAGGTGINNGASTITIGGNVTFSGAHMFTGTITGDTAITFPTSGTLATTAGTVATVTGTANQINSTGGTTPVLSLSSTTVFPGTVTLNADPTLPLQACTKQYADAIAASINIKNACYAASTGAYAATYANGAAGVGATLTNNAALAAFTSDGTTPAAGSRILIKNQASSFQNGIYTVTVAGSGAVAWVLTRALDYDTPAEIYPGNLVPIANGTVNASTSWLETATVTTVGTDAITFLQFTFANPVTNVTASSPLASSGGQTPNITLNTQVPLSLGGTNANLTASNGGIFYSTASSGAILAATATALQMLQSGASGAPSWSTATWPATTTANQLLYSSATNTVAGLATANNAVVITDGSGVPALSSTPSGLTSLGVGNLSLFGGTVGSSGNLVLGANSGAGSIELLGASAYVPAGGSFYMYNAGNTHYTGFKATAAASDVIYALPSDAPAGNGYALVCTTAGAMSWVSSPTGSVSSVTGTANRITSSGGATPVIDIAATYEGQSSITKLGTIGTGVWNGTVVTGTYGGTGVNNGASTMTIGGNFATSGAFTTTLTVTGNTNVTLPTSGTLVNTAVTMLSSLVSIGTITTGTWNGTVVGGAYGGTGVNNGTSTITLGGNLTTSGAFASTFTITNTTSVTFPTSGTLATTAQLPQKVNQASSSVTMVANTTYTCDNGASLITFTLPASATKGDSFTIIGGSSGGWTIAQNASQFIGGGATTTTTGVGGSLASTNQYQSVTLTCTTTNNGFTASGYAGNFTVV